MSHPQYTAVTSSIFALTASFVTVGALAFVLSRESTVVQRRQIKERLSKKEQHPFSQLLQELSLSSSHESAKLQHFVLSANERQSDSRLAIKLVSVGCGSTSIQGERDHMEDTFCTRLVNRAAFSSQPQGTITTSPLDQAPTSPSSSSSNPPPSDIQPILGFFGIYDGHGGVAASDYLAKHLHKTFIKILRSLIHTPSTLHNGGEQDNDALHFLNIGQETPLYASSDQVSVALERAIQKVDRAFIMHNENSASRRCGSTACITVLLGDRVVVANVGDSRAIMCRFNADAVLTNKTQPLVVELTSDHKPNRLDEMARIENAGGVVRRGRMFGIESGPFRVYDRNLRGGLAMSRAIGDAFLKPRLVAQLKQEMRNNKKPLSVSPLSSPVRSSGSSSRSSSSSGSSDDDLVHSSPPNSPSPLSSANQPSANYRIQQASSVLTGASSSSSKTQSRRQLRKEKRKRRKERRLKNFVISTPEITHEKLAQQDKNMQQDSAFIVLASDGLWDVMSSQEVANFVIDYCQRHKTQDPLHAENISALLVDRASEKGSGDNITVTVVFLKQHDQTRAKL